MFRSRFNHQCLLTLVNKCQLLKSISKRVFSSSQVIASKQTKDKRRRQTKGTETEHVQYSIPVAVQLLSKSLDLGTHIEKPSLHVISEEELKTTLDEISWDTKATINKLDSENSENDIDKCEEHQVEESLDDDDYIETITLDDNNFPGKPQKKQREHRIVGTPDASVPRTDIPCTGCGARLHCRDPQLPGYIPSEKFKMLTVNDMKRSVCQRCHLMTSYNIYLNVNVDANEYPQIISKIKSTVGLVIVVVDLTDMRNSIFPDLLKYIGRQRPLYIIGNKVDLIPKDNDDYLTRTTKKLFDECENAGLNDSGKNIRHVCLVSAKTGYGIEELVTKLLKDWNRKGDVFLVGCTNVGKSSVFNAVLQSDYCKSTIKDLVRRATISLWPGTTLSLLKFPVVQPDAWRIAARDRRLWKSQSERKEQKKLEKSLKNSSNQMKYATLQGYINRTDFRNDYQIRRDEAEEDPAFQGQELVSFSWSKSEDLREVSGRSQIVEEADPPDMSILDKLTQSRWTYDTPGVANPQQIINLLTPEELQVILPKKRFQPTVFVVQPSQAMWISGLGRIDYCQGDRSIFLTVHCSPNLPVHVMELSRADSFYEEKIGSKEMAVPIVEDGRLDKLPPLAGRDFHVTGISWDQAAVDIQLSSLGWVSVMAQRGDDVTLRAYTPGGLGCHLRSPALLPHVLAFRGARLKNTAEYSRTKPKITD